MHYKFNTNLIKYSTHFFSIGFLSIRIIYHAFTITMLRSGLEALNCYFCIGTNCLQIAHFMKIALVQTGRTSDKHVAEIADLYLSRIRKYVAFEIITLPDIKNSGNLSVQEHKVKEGKKIIQTTGNDDYIVVLDERGKEFRTVEFSGWLEKAFMISRKRIVFVIGGPWGFSDEVYEKADFMISLSKMTFPHQLVRLLFLEQLYRVFTIIRGEPYHHE
jgi:23S rRNA (pseudouridine1915-N3)-methyltransferase